MADLKISALTSAGALAGTEPLPIVQGGSTKKTTAQDIANLKATPNLQQVTTAGFTTTTKIISSNGAGSATILNNGNIDIATGDETVTIEASLVTTAYTAKLPDKPTSPQTFAMLSDITGGGGIPHETASGTDTYTATITGVASYADGDAYLIRFTNGNTSAATLNINSLGAKSLYRNNDGAIIGGDIWAGGEMLCVYNSTLNIFQCIGTSPNSIFAYITNADSVTITKGQVVYAFGGTGDRMTVKRAINTSDATSARTVGVVYSTSIAANAKGIIILQGLLDGLSILPTSTYADGDSIYLGATAGSITNVKPYAPNHLVYVATVTTASNGSAGRMYVRIQNGYEMDELHDVSAQTPANKNGLFFNSSNSLWEARAVEATDIDANVSNTEFGYLDGVTSAIQTQLNSKQAKTISNCADGTAITGVTTNQYSKGLLIPANSRGANDAPQIEVTALKTGSGGNVTIRMYWNTTNDITTGSPILLGTFGPNAANSMAMVRVLMIQVANGSGNATRTAIATGNSAIGWVAGGAAASTLAINWTIDGYLICAVQNTSGTDSTVGVMVKLN
jgi:hypothetical protein